MYLDGGLNSGPFDDRTGLNHSNTGLVRYSDPHFILVMTQIFFEILFKTKHLVKSALFEISFFNAGCIVFTALRFIKFPFAKTHVNKKKISVVFLIFKHDLLQKLTLQQAYILSDQKDWQIIQKNNKIQTCFLII